MMRPGWSMPSAATCIAAVWLAIGGVAKAEEPTETAPTSPWTYGLSVGGNIVTGNLYQIQVSGSGRLTYDRERVRNEVFANGFRLWIRADDDILLFGDDVTVGNIFTFRFGQRVRAVGFTYLAWSQLHRIDLRLGAGVGPVVQLLDGTTQSLRVGLLGFVERTAWPGTTFNRSIDHRNGVLTIPRLTLLTDGRLSVPKTPLSFRYIGYLHVNPLDVGDVRGQIQGSVDVRIAGPLQISLSGQIAGSSVVLEGVRPIDARATAGLTLAPPPPPSEDP